MNTLKMKVLLILSNRYLHRSFVKALLTWLSANVLGCSILYSLGYFFLQSASDLMTSLMLSLIFSSPAVLIATWLIYSLPLLTSWLMRTIISLTAILITSMSIIALVAQIVHLEYLEVARILYPFAITALVSFFFIVRKQFIHN